VVYAIGTCIYNLFFHPLKHIPGPFFARACGIPYSLQMRSGQIVNWIRTQHEIYGDAVRVGPSEVSFISADTAWPDIYGFRTGKHKDTGPYLKDRGWFPKPVNGVYSLIVANEADHTRMRRNLSHAFSDKALRSQEPLMQRYADELVTKLGDRADQGDTVDIMRWYR
jgi:cytochrome P450